MSSVSSAQSRADSEITDKGSSGGGHKERLLLVTFDSPLVPPLVGFGFVVGCRPMLFRFIANMWFDPRC